MKKMLVAGPWIGEFGYELFRWQGHLRYLSQDYEEVIVAGRPGHSVLYDDFATEYHNFTCGVGTNAADGRHCGVDTDLVSISQQLFSGRPFMRMVCPEQKVVDEDPQVFKRYGEHGAHRGYDLIIHARAINVDEGVMLDHHKAQKESRNWDGNHWAELLVQLRTAGLTIACIGMPEAAHWIPGTEDLRGMPLGQLVDVLANSRLAVGPSSGPMHLASLCGCKHITWGEAHLEQRYKRVWNPFETTVDFIVADDYDPPVAIVRNVVGQSLY